MSSVRAGRVAVGAMIGFFIGGLVGVAATAFPVFDWEMAGLPVLIFAPLAGMVAGGIGPNRSFVAGALAGAVPFGTLHAAIQLNEKAKGSLPPDNLPAPGLVWHLHVLYVPVHMVFGKANLLTTCRSGLPRDYCLSTTTHIGARLARKGQCHDCGHR